MTYTPEQLKDKLIKELQAEHVVSHHHHQRR